MAQSPTTAPSAVPTLDVMYRAVIGAENTDFYLRYFGKRDAGGGFLSWNWPVLFVQFPWSLFRKMWGFALGGLALQFVGSVIVANTVFAVLRALMSSTTNIYTEYIARASALLLGSAFPAMFANGFYHRKVHRLIRETAHIVDPETRLQELARRGGTSSAWVWFFLPIVASVVLALMRFFIWP